MSAFLDYLHRRSRGSFHLDDSEHAKITGVMRRIRNAIEKGKGIRLSAEELQVLGLYGLKKDADPEPPNE